MELMGHIPGIAMRNHDQRLGEARSTLCKRGGLNGWTQHWLEVYSQESENLGFFSGVGLSAALLCPVPTGNSRTGLFSSGRFVVTAHSFFRSHPAPTVFPDHTSRPSHLI